MQSLTSNNKNNKMLNYSSFTSITNSFHNFTNLVTGTSQFSNHKFDSIHFQVLKVCGNNDHFIKHNVYRYSLNFWKECSIKNIPHRIHEKIALRFHSWTCGTHGQGTHRVSDTYPHVSTSWPETISVNSTRTNN
jgi:hypothetical protein